MNIIKLQELSNEFAEEVERMRTDSNKSEFKKHTNNTGIGFKDPNKLVSIPPNHYRIGKQNIQDESNQKLIWKNVFDDLRPKIGKKESNGKLHIEYNWDFLEAQFRRMGKNKAKYNEGNWTKPMDISELKKALMRHTLEILKGNYEDDGDEYGHLAAIALNVSFIEYQLKNYK